jgi:ribosomal protein L29
MTIIRNKEIKKMEKKERNEKLKELSLALVQSRIQGTKSKNISPKEVKKAIARIKTFNTIEKGVLKKA